MSLVLLSNNARKATVWIRGLRILLSRADAHTLHPPTQPRTHACAHTHTHTHIHTYTYTHTHVRAHTHPHTYTHINTPSHPPTHNDYKTTKKRARTPLHTCTSLSLESMEIIISKTQC